MIRRLLLPALLIVGVAACSSPKTKSDQQPVEPVVEEAVEAEPTFKEKLAALAAGEHRDPAHIDRNQYRNPVETLLFFGLEPGWTVVELNPGGGWYTEILAPALSAEGKFVAAYPIEEHAEGYVKEMVGKFDAKLAASPEIYGSTQRAYLHPGQRVEFGEEASADLVLTFRNIHGWNNRGQLEEIMTEAHRVLKPGGILGVVQHRAADDADLEAIAKSGYLPQAFVIETLEGMGFELVSASEINANARDTRDHPEGVWTLPPALRLGDVDRDKYVEIGESDRMTLKFRKAM